MSDSPQIFWRNVARENFTTRTGLGGEAKIFNSPPKSAIAFFATKPGVAPVPLSAMARPE
jgi:hypothetical protein